MMSDDASPPRRKRAFFLRLANELGLSDEMQVGYLLGFVQGPEPDDEESREALEQEAVLFEDFMLEMALKCFGLEASKPSSWSKLATGSKIAWIKRRAVSMTS